ncbi:histidine ammonia-lyase [Burkholderia sp. FERM BP-3421]|jgi:histidine ammonia-lyase|uniref:histidine ammonia-lyase n=1 Tax=Burkholderia sp. FERM BP-3421 TaxID=1494466 RepID=UPI00236268DD|nr:histidine ammonia-lyase [Burkholderia sp. FERM BP-3421]WDD93547.1 histidine ammonia-lyase [Burkholderia sp. FERM BP-3421]
MDKTAQHILTPGTVTLRQLRSIHEQGSPFLIDPAALAGVARAQDVVATLISEGKTAYGINTGFGKLAHTIIPTDKLKQLQENLVLSHSVGTGECLDDKTVRLIMALKAVSLARGYSGVRPVVIERIVQLANHGFYPRIPSKGSVGASGDLAPLAHLAAALIGVGRVNYRGTEMSALDALELAGVAPLELGPKEGLALLNGTQVSTALGLVGLFGAERVFAAAVTTGSLSLEAIMGSKVPFDARIHAARGQQGQIDVAAIYADMLDGSAILDSHADCGRVQDPYSIRCQPQVMGACLQQIRNAAEVLRVESNAASDNPLIFSNEGDILSGGNFHAEPVAFASDALAIAIAEIGAISERRIALLLDTHLSGLPAFLVKESGLNSGFMIAQVTAAALASENKSLAHPASVDSLPTSANQEDHVSMATFAGRRLATMVDNTAGVVAIEALAAAQGVEFRRPLRSAENIEAAIDEIRARVPAYDEDRFFAPDLQAAKDWVMTYHLPHRHQTTLPSYTE